MTTYLKEIAKTLKYQSDVFNVPYEQAWEKYMVPAIRRNCELKDLLPYLEQLEKESQEAIRKNVKSINGGIGRKLVAQYENFRFECHPKVHGYRLIIYKDNKHFYTHGLLLPNPKTATTVSRRVTNLSRIELDWIDNLTHQKICVKPAFIN